MKRLKIGIIGAGRIGSLHAKSITYNVPTATVVGITDVFMANAEKVAAELNIPKIYSDYKEMLDDIVKSYQKAVEHIGADFIIPSGEVFGAMLENGIEKIHRDTFHASLGLGRYALGLIWYKTLTGNDVLENPFCDFDEEVSAEQLVIAKKCVQEVANRYRV